MTTLLPTREGQARVMTITASPDATHCERGHWYSPQAVADMLTAERERCAKVCEMESVTLATRDQTRGALYCADMIRKGVPT